MAGKIPQRFIDDLIDRLDIVDVVSARIDLRKAGKNHTARCPFHDEKTPSFSVNPDKQFYYCFGCGAGGNALSFVMDYDHLDFPQAVELLAASIGLEVPRDGRPGDDKKNQQRQRLLDALAAADQFYRRQLRQHPQANAAIDYLKQRGLSGEAARDFGIGFAPPGWDNLLATAEANPDRIATLIEAGLVVSNEEENKRYDRFRNRIIFPIRDPRGRTIAFGGRVLGDDKPKYLNSPETPVFHKGRELYGLYETTRHTRNPEHIIVVEGYMDAVALAQQGIHSAVATLGTALSEAHLDKLFRYTAEVIFCFDGDEAGRKAAARALETCLPAMRDGRGCRFLFLPEGEDPDSLVRAIGAESFRQLVTEATPLSTHLFESLSTKLDLSLPDDRAKLYQLAAPLINRLPHGVFRTLMLNQLAEKTGLANDALALHIEGNTTQSGDASPPPVPGTSPYDYPEYNAEPDAETNDYASYHEAQHAPEASNRKTVKLTPVQLLIGMLTHQPALSEAINDDDIKLLETSEEPDVSLLLKVLKLLAEHPEYTLTRLLGYWRGIHGVEQGEYLSVIANNDLVTGCQSDESRQALTQDIVTGLRRKARSELPVEAQISALAEKPQLDEDDRRQALTLWQTLAHSRADESLINQIKQILKK